MPLKRHARVTDEPDARAVNRRPSPNRKGAFREKQTMLMQTLHRCVIAGSTILCTALATGCVERTMKITTDPAGARVFLNDEEVGLTPLRTSFVWYGDYDIVIRKAGYRTLKTNYRIAAPWYQIPPIDLITECFLPGTIRDEHELPLYTLEAEAVEPAADLVERAVEMRDRTLYQGE